jgi:hypothetical protein
MTLFWDMTLFDLVQKYEFLEAAFLLDKSLRATTLVLPAVNTQSLT